MISNALTVTVSQKKNSRISAKRIDLIYNITLNQIPREADIIFN